MQTKAWITGASRTRLCLAGTFIVLAAVAAFSQAPGRGPKLNPEQMAARFRQMSADYEQKGLAEPFRGITAKGQVEPNLYQIRATGVSTEPVRKAAEAFLAGLTPDQRAKTIYPVNDPEWRKWMNQHFYMRQGVSFQEMNEQQRELGFKLLRAALSARGFQLTRDIMRLNETLAELTGDFDFLGEWRYHFTVMGKPDPKEPWGFQFDGHHAIINYFVLGDQVVMTPLFVGSEPVVAESGKYKGTAVLQDEQDRGRAMLLALSDEQRKKAVLEVSKTGNNNLTEAFKDNVVLDYAGVKAADLKPEQKMQLTDLIALYVGNMDDGHARVKIEEVKKHLDQTWFAWIGGSDTDSVYYYRIQSPVLLIEFDHQRPANLGQFAKDPRAVTRKHIHVVVRTPNGNDYGKDLLRLHYQAHPHTT
jgi:hypothetical protein